MAATLFFLAGFTILQLVIQSLSMARALRQSTVDAGSLAAELSLTNRLEAGVIESGDFGSLYPGYVWQREVMEEWTNGFFRVVFTVQNADRPGGQPSTLTVLMYRPQSTGGRASVNPRR